MSVLRNVNGLNAYTFSRDNGKSISTKVFIDEKWLRIRSIAEGSGGNIHRYSSWNPSSLSAKNPNERILQIQ